MASGRRANNHIQGYSDTREWKQKNQPPSNIAGKPGFYIQEGKSGIPFIACEEVDNSIRPWRQTRLMKIVHTNDVTVILALLSPFRYIGPSFRELTYLRRGGRWVRGWRDGFDVILPVQHRGLCAVLVSHSFPSSSARVPNLLYSLSSEAPTSGAMEEPD